MTWGESILESIFKGTEAKKKKGYLRKDTNFEIYTSYPYLKESGERIGKEHSLREPVFTSTSATYLLDCLW